MDEAMVMEELVNCHGSSVPGPENTGEVIGPCPKVRESPDIVHWMSDSRLEGILLLIGSIIRIIIILLNSHTMGSQSPRILRSLTCISTRCDGCVLSTILPSAVTEHPIFRSLALCIRMKHM